MDVRTALKLSISFPLASGQVEVIATKRGFTETMLAEEFTTKIANSRSYELTYADSLKMLVTHPNVSEGGVSISISDRESLIAIANDIYRKYNEPIIQEEHPAVYPIED